MRKLDELKEISDLNIKTELSQKELAIVDYFKGHPDKLVNDFHHFSTQEKLSIINYFTKGQKIEAELNCVTGQCVFNQAELNELFSHDKPLIFIDENVLDLLKSKNIESLDVELIEKNDSLGLFKTTEKPSTFIDNKVKNILSKSSPKVKGMTSNLVLTSALMLGTAMFSSCGAGGITAKVNYKTPAPISIPAIGEVSGDFELTFANHAVHSDEDDEINSFKAIELMLLEVPKTISKVSYLSDRVKPTLTLTANNQYVCSYIWVNAGQSNPTALDTSVATVGEYRMHRSCFLEMQTEDGMVIKVENVPKAKTVTLKFNFEK